MNAPQPSAESFELIDGAIALPGGLLWLSRSKTLVAADAHLGYEDVIGSALPLWSTAETTQTLLLAARRMQANEIVFLGDIIHSTRMSESAAKTVNNALNLLRKECAITLIAGNHEGRTRGTAILGETKDAIERDNWFLLHGDEPLQSHRCIIGHLHPSLPLDANHSVPVFLAAPHLIVVPALTPYSSGLNILSSDCTDALRMFGETKDITVIATGQDRVYPFGKRHALQRVMWSGTRPTRNRLRHDPPHAN